VAHTDCPSQACLPDGSCGDDSNVAYVDVDGTDNATCTKLAPCTKIAADALVTNRPYIKLHGVITETLAIARDVVLLADPGAELVGNSSTATLTLQGNAQVGIFDLAFGHAGGTSGTSIVMAAGNTATVAVVRAAIVGGSVGIDVKAGTLSVTQSTIKSVNGDGIDIEGGTLSLGQSTISGTQGGGVESSGGAVSIVQSTLTNNQRGGIYSGGGSLSVLQSTIESNPAGGIDVSNASSQFDIRNNFIDHNGQTTASVGGVRVGGTLVTADRLEFNTIVDNLGGVTSGGVTCNVTNLVAANNIIARNSLMDMTTATNAQTFGACTFPTSKVANDMTGLAFVNADAPPYDYHLRVGSVAIDHATTATTTIIDFDGDARPQGAADDQGADEFKP
jgi:hypothetical protein